MRRRRIGAAVACFVIACSAAGVPTRAAERGDSEACIACHEQVTPGIVNDWRTSRMAGAGMGCTACHVPADETRPDVHEHNGTRIVTAVSPKDCGRCHAQEAKEFLASHHARAAQFIGSLDNVLGEVVGGPPAADVGCRQCHGSVLAVGAEGKLNAATWPNTGIGRVNLDGTSGSCAACHARHSFSVAVARQPESCGKCHLGPDHPQLEIYQESKHGVLFRANQTKMNLEREGGQWVPGKDHLYPTCASCHMSATRTQAVTHDIGRRIAWTLRPVVSTQQPDYEARKSAMQEVCQNCHSASYAANFYAQYESQVKLYNDKFARPAKQLMDQLAAEKLITPTPFDDHIEWTYYLLWHHEGRRARHGAAMAGPDYAWWHGMFEVANCFYNEFLPEAERLKPGVTQPVLATDYHRWRKGMSKEEVKQILEFHRTRYQQ